MARKVTAQRRSLLTIALTGGLIVKQITGSNSLALTVVDQFLKTSFEKERSEEMKAYRQYSFPPVVIQLEDQAEVDAMLVALDIANRPVMVSQGAKDPAAPHRAFYVTLRERIQDAIKDRG